MIRTVRFAALAVLSVVAFAAQAATTLATIPAGNYSGTVTVPSSALPATATEITATIDVTNMTDPATSFDASFDISYDSGATWGFLVSAHHDGGPVLLDRHGTPVTTFMVGTGLYQQGSATRRIRGTVTIVGTVNVSGSVTAQ